MAPFIAQLLADPYGVVRNVSARSLHTLPDYRDFQFDFLGKPEYLAERADVAARKWTPLARTNIDKSAIQLDKKGQVQTNALVQLLRARDGRSVTIKE